MNKNKTAQTEKSKQNHIKTALIGDYVQCYSGYANDTKIRHDASSGGVITALLIFALEKKIIDGAVLVRPSKENILLSEAFIARSRQEIISASRSRYCPSERGNVLKQIISSNKDEKLAFVGLPCHILSIKKFIQANPGLEEKIILFFGLFCGGVPSFKGLRFFLEKNNIKEKDIEKIDYRGGGWPGIVKIFKKNGETGNFAFPFFWTIAASSFFWQRSCMICSDCTSQEADLSFGDAWLKEFDNDKIGRSLVVCRTKKSNELLTAAEDSCSLHLEKILPSKVIQSQIVNIYLKKKGLLGRSDSGIKMDLADRILFSLFLLNQKIGEDKYFSKMLQAIPVKIISLYLRILGKICHKKASLDFCEYIS